jgi:hypothetical protein
MTIQQLAARVLEVIRQHERNCSHCIGVGLACVECDECRAVMEDLVVDELRKANRRA